MKIESSGKEHKRDKRGAQLQARLNEFAVRIMVVAAALPDSLVGRHVAEQIIRVDTSPAPNYAEALGSESRTEFIHKIGVVLKELRETNVWLQTIASATLIKPVERLAPIRQECDQLVSVFVSSVNTARNPALSH